MPETKNSTSVGAFLWAVKRHWVTLAGGCTAIVLLGAIEKISGKNVPWWAYLVLLALLFCVACYLAWQDARKELEGHDDTERKKKEYLAERISTLLREDGEVDLGFGSSKDDPGNMRAMFRWQNYRWRVVRFLEAHYDEQTVKRFQKGGTQVLEQLLADCYKDDPKNLTVIQKSVDTKN